jgi:hypothetical protein
LRYHAEHHGRNWCIKIFIYPKFRGTHEVLKRPALEVLYLVVELNFVVCLVYCFVYMLNHSRA